MAKRQPTGAAAKGKRRRKSVTKAAKALRAGMPAPTGTPKEDIATVERMFEALELRKQGYSYKQIGEWLDPPCVTSAAERLVKRAMTELLDDTADAAAEVRRLDLARLDDLLPSFMKRAGEGNDFALSSVLKIMERRAQLVGADAPQKQEIGGPNGGPIPIARVEVIVIDPAGGSVPDATLGGALPPPGSV